MKIFKKIDPNCGETELTVRTYSELEYQKIADKFDDRLRLDTTEGLRLVKRSELVYVEAMKNYLELHAQTGESYTVRSPLYKMKESLGSDFIQLSRSYLINFDKLTAVEADLVNGMVARVAGLKIPISRSYLKEIYRKLEEK